MEERCLRDSDVYPDDDVLSGCLGDAKDTWDVFERLLTENYPGFSREWRYYKDGNSWLCKVTKKKKTICWVSVWAGAFKVTFYFPDRAEELITTGKLKKPYVDQFLHGRKCGKIRGVTVTAKRPADLPSVKKLIEIKERLK